MSCSTTYLVTGASRGIGLGFVDELLKRPSTFVYAGCRDPSAPALQARLKQYGSGRLKILKIVAADKEGNDAAAAVVKQDGRALDVVLANAGIFLNTQPVLEVDIAAIQEHFTVNTIGQVQLLQSFQHVLVKDGAKFVAISSSAACMSNPPPLPVGAYGASKAALNFLMLMLHNETKNTGLVAFPVNPGLTQTDLADDFSRCLGIPLENFPQANTVEQAVTMMLKTIDIATRESHGGKWWDVDGTQQAF